MEKISFNKPTLIGKEIQYIVESVLSLKTSGNGEFTKRCQSFFEQRYGFKKCLLTTSCTDALEMASLLLNIEKDDEVIVPSYTFVSTANAFVLRGAKIVFADSCEDHPNMDVNKVEELITPKTKAIVVVHYGGAAVDMDPLMELATKYNISIIEDAAQAIDSFYKGRPLGGIGHLGAFSFHETKNIISGEGGMLVVNDPELVKRAEIIWEKGTNRTAFFRGEVDKYNWVDVGSSFLPSEIVTAFLWAQLENLDKIQTRRKQHWETYYQNLKELEGKVGLAKVPEYATNNGHLFYITCKDEEERDELIAFLKEVNIHAVFHYLSLHKSPFYADKHDGRELPNADRFSECLLRLPLFYELTETQIVFICDRIKLFYSR